MISETKTYDSISVENFFIDGYSPPKRLGKFLDRLAFL